MDFKSGHTGTDKIISQRPMQLHFLHNIIHMHGTMLRAVQIIVSDFYVPAFLPYYCISCGFSAMCVCHFILSYSISHIELVRLKNRTTLAPSEQKMKSHSHD